MILPVMANRIRARTQIFKAMPETGINEGYRLKLSIESPCLYTGECQNNKSYDETVGCQKMRGSNCCYEILLKKMPIAESVRKLWKIMR
jgi:hypothetical protein